MPDLPGHIRCLLMVIIRPVIAKFLAAVTVRPQFLALSAAVVADYRIRRVQNVPLAPVVLLQLDDLRLRKIRLKVQDVPDIRPAPLVNALVVVPDHAQIVVPVRQLADQPVLNMVRILILVHHDILKTLLVAQQNLLIPLKEFHSVQQDIVKVHRIVLPQPLLVLSVHQVNRLCFIIILHCLPVLLRIHALLLLVADHCQQILRREFPVADPVFLQDVFHQSLLISAVVDDKVRLVPRFLRIDSQNAKAHGVKGHDPHGSRPVSRQLLHSLPHFPGGLVGKGHRQYAVRRNPLFKHMSDTMGHGACLAGTRARQNQQRSLQLTHRLLLPGIQIFKTHSLLSIHLSA